MIKIIAVGKIKEKAYTSLIQEFTKRLSAYTKLEIIEVKEEVCNVNNSEAENNIVKKKESINLLSKIKDNDYVIALDLHGKMITSETLAQHIQEVFTYKSSNITFVIAGSLGYDEILYNRADYRLKISDMTFPHQMVRVMLVEQIYRSYKINNKETYHK